MNELEAPGGTTFEAFQAPASGVPYVDGEGCAIAHVADDQGSRDLRLELVLEVALVRPGAVNRIEPLSRDVLAGQFGEEEAHAAIEQPLSQVFRLVAGRRCACFRRG